MPSLDAPPRLEPGWTVDHRDPGVSSGYTRVMVSTDRHDLPAQPFESVLAAARTGDSEALEELFRRFYPTVEEMVHARLAQDVRIGRPWLGARFSTGDVVQEVFRSLLRNLDSFQGRTESAFCGYLAMAVKNRLVDAIRFHQADQRDGRRTQSDEDDVRPAPQGRSPGSEVASMDELRVLHEALQAFDEREQLLLRGRLEQDVSFENLAEQLGYSSRSAAQRAFYAAKARLTLLIKRGSAGETAPGDG